MTGSEESRKMITIELAGKGKYEVAAGSRINNLVAAYYKDHKMPIVGALIQNEMQDLNCVLQDGDKVEMVDIANEDGVRIYRRSALLILLKACHDLFPERTLMVRHSLSEGVFCEFPQQEVTPAEVKSLEEYMRDIENQNIPIERFIVHMKEALEIFTALKQSDLVELLQQRNKNTIHVCKIDDFYEYFYGLVLTNTGQINQFRLIYYPPGIVLQTPVKKSPGVLMPFVEQKKLASIYSEEKAWAEMLDAPHVPAVNKIISQGGFNDLIRINEALHEKKIADIADRICSNKDIRIILIAGPSSSGKTTFAQRLFIQLKVNGRQPMAISLDNYFVDRCNTPLDEDNEYDFESLDALKLDLFNEHLQQLINGEEVEMPVYNFIKGTCEAEGRKIKLGAGQPLILEGIHCLNDQLTSSIYAKQKFKIYISALTQLNIDYSNNISTTDSRLVRRILRDNRTRGHNALNTIRRWPSVRRGEEKNIFPFQENADAMFNSSLVYELFVLKPFIEPLLNQVGTDNREYAEAMRLQKFLSYFTPVILEGREIPYNSILREFVGNSCFE
ncbi:MAG TPA: nucleoside kinase [Syntrophomonadaceae bacterium]|nr:nucleoside kinase [Syntrophomonadaceae bacterium]HPR94100.1 nucleoside kinase [Syntrophomonadaceae bacterium]